MQTFTIEVAVAGGTKKLETVPLDTYKEIQTVWLKYKTEQNSTRKKQLGNTPFKIGGHTGVVADIRRMYAEEVTVKEKQTKLLTQDDIKAFKTLVEPFFLKEGTDEWERIKNYIVSDLASSGEPMWDKQLAEHIKTVRSAIQKQLSEMADKIIREYFKTHITQKNWKEFLISQGILRIDARGAELFNPNKTTEYERFENLRESFVQRESKARFGEQKRLEQYDKLAESINK